MLRRNERGAVAVEFALLLPLIVIFLFATIEFGLGLARLEDYENAAREGARVTALHCPATPGSPSCTLDYVWSVIRNSSPDYSANPIYATAPTGACTGGTNTVACEFRFCSRPIATSAGACPSGSPSSLNCTPSDAVTVSWQQRFVFSVPFLSIAPRMRTITGVFRCE
jgi:Flp pilus assembly protein TadG